MLYTPGIWWEMFWVWQTIKNSFFFSYEFRRYYCKATKYYGYCCYSLFSILLCTRVDANYTTAIILCIYHVRTINASNSWRIWTLSILHLFRPIFQCREDFRNHVDSKILIGIENIKITIACIRRILVQLKLVIRGGSALLHSWYVFLSGRNRMSNFMYFDVSIVYSILPLLQYYFSITITTTTVLLLPQLLLILLTRFTQLTCNL